MVKNGTDVENMGEREQALCSRGKPKLFLHGDALAKVGVGDEARMLILLQRSPRLSQALAVPALPGLAGQQREPQGAKAPARALGRVFTVDFLKPVLQSA